MSLVCVCAWCTGLCVCMYACVFQEILGIFLAIATFSDLLRDRRVVLYSDNKGELPYCSCARPLPDCMTFQVPNTPPGVARQRPSITTRSFMKSGRWFSGISMLCHLALFLLCMCLLVFSGTASIYGSRGFPPMTTSVTYHLVVSTDCCRSLAPSGADLSGSCGDTPVRRCQAFA